MTDTDRTRRLLDELMPVPAAPADFARRVFERRDRGGIRPPRRRWPWATGVAAALAAAAVIIVVRRHGPEGGSAPRASARQTVHMGAGAVAVVEPHGELAWRRQGGQVRVEQRRGDVFYRVDHGGSFVVVAPPGEIAVTGTCFRVALQGPASDAAYVQVLEGSLEVRNSAGKTALAAGEWGRLVAGRAPERMTRVPSSSLPLALDQLFARAQDPVGPVAVQQRAQVAAPPAEDPAETPARKLAVLTAEERLAFARRCTFRWGLPRHLNRAEISTPDDGPPITAEERAAVLKILEDHRAEYFEQLRGIYTEVTGEHADPTVAAMALHHEIDGKASRAEGKTARRRILQEWAGDVEPQAPGAALPAIERFWRLQVGAIDDTVRRLIPVVGPDRARALVGALVDLGVTGSERGCPSGKRP